MFIIAEVGSNIFKTDSPSANLKIAYEQIVKAKRCGADAVKFQMFTSKELYGEVYESVDKYALPRAWVASLKECCDDNDIDFMCSCFSVGGYEFIDPYVRMHKVASPEVTDVNIVAYLKRQDKPVIWSNGCSHVSTWGHKMKDVILNCVSQYPATEYDYDYSPPSQDSIYTWGISDHTKELIAALITRKQGGSYFEKHVDLLRHEGNTTPDACVSMNEIDFGHYCRVLRAHKPIDFDEQRQEAYQLYGRKHVDGEWFRPLPS